MPAAIDPDAIPGKDLNPEAVEENARTIGTLAGEVRDNGSSVHHKWQGMAGVYDAPEAGTLLGLMQPVSSQATQAGDNLDEVSAALIQFAADSRPIKDALDQLRIDAQAFRAEIAGGVSVREVNPAYVSAQGYQGSWNAYGAASTTTASADIPQYRTITKQWHEVQSYVDRNNDLISAVNVQQVALWDAERACANKIRALYGAAALHAFQSEDDVNGYGLSEIPEGTEMPWGAPTSRTESCGEAAANFVVKDFLWEGIVVGGVWGTIQGLGTLVLGYNPATGDWFSGEAYGAAWSNLGLLAAGAVIATTPPLNLLNAVDDAVQQFGGEGILPGPVGDFDDKVDEAFLNTGKALIAWDKWADDPGTAAGESLFNVATALIPAGAAVAGVKTASVAASVLTKMARVVDLVDPAAWAVNGTLRVGSAGLGSLDTLIGRLDPPASSLDTPHIETYTAMDSASALRTLDDWGVDLNAVTARVDEGVPVLEAPGARVELPAGAFDGIRAVDGATDAAIPSPVHEPELVAAGGGQGGSGTAGSGIGGSASGGGGASVPPHTGLDAPPPHTGADAPALPLDDIAKINGEYRLPSGEVDPSHLDAWSEEISAAYPALAPEQVRGIYDYTTNPGYEEMNPYLRGYGSTPADIPGLEDRITNVTQGLANLPAEPSFQTLYSRGVTLNPDFLAQFQPGERWSDPSFMSSSSNPAVAEDFAQAALAKGEMPGIITIDGRTPVSITPLSRYQFEAEFLFQRGTEFDVVSRFQDENGIWHIHLREVVR